MAAHNIPTDFQKLRPIQLSGPPQKSNYEGFELGPFPFKVHSHKLTLAPGLSRRCMPNMSRHTEIVTNARGISQNLT